jgi:hypothetical protein
MRSAPQVASGSGSGTVPAIAPPPPVKTEDQETAAMVRTVDAQWHAEDLAMLSTLTGPLETFRRSFEIGFQPVLDGEMRALLTAVDRYIAALPKANRLSRSTANMRNVAVVEVFKLARFLQHATAILLAVLAVWPQASMVSIKDALHTKSTTWKWEPIDLPKTTRGVEGMTLEDVYIGGVFILVNQKGPGCIYGRVNMETFVADNGSTYIKQSTPWSGSLTALTPFESKATFASESTNYIASVFRRSTGSFDHTTLFRAVFATPTPLDPQAADDDDEHTHRRPIDVAHIAKVFRRCITKVTVRDFVAAMITKRVPAREALESLTWPDFAKAFLLGMTESSCTVTGVPIPCGMMTLPIVTETADADLKASMAKEAFEQRTQLFTKVGGSEIDPPRYLEWVYKHDACESNVFADSPLIRVKPTFDHGSEIATDVDRYGPITLASIELHDTTWILGTLPLRINEFLHDPAYRARFAKGHMEFLVDHRPGVVSADEAADLVAYFENAAK